jgi:hypothetical protein
MDTPMRRLRAMMALEAAHCVWPSVTVLAYCVASARVSAKSVRVVWLCGNVSTRQHSSLDSSVCSKHGLPPAARASRQSGGSPMRPYARMLSSHANPGSPFFTTRAAMPSYRCPRRAKTELLDVQP